MAYWEYYLMGIVLLPGIVFALIAQARVTSAYNKYAKISAHNNVKAVDAVKKVLDGASMSSVKIEQISGNLTDHYDPSNNTVRLSDGIYNSTSIAALGIAMHEVGHAIQYNKNYFPIKFRNFSIKFSNVISYALWPLVIIGLIFNFIYLDGFWGEVFVWSGIAFFALSAFINLITLPVEYDASKRAIKILEATNLLDESEIPACREVLNAAALTYVAALVVSLLNLLRFILVIRNRD
ncbi:MAG: zinc metallopeptidase [Clostridia bacterium]|nr:zinc metallopeptidase [Clostridia bacterium]